MPPWYPLERPNRGESVSVPPSPPRAALVVGPWAIGTFAAAASLPLYLTASTRPAFEAVSESPTLWSAVVGFGLLMTIAVAVGTWSRAAWRPLRTVLLSGAIAGAVGTASYGTYVYWFSSATLASGSGAPDVGERPPAFSITDPEGRVRSLDAYAGKTLLLVFYRGHW